MIQSWSCCGYDWTLKNTPVHSTGLRLAVVLAAGSLFVGKVLQTLQFVNNTVDTIHMNVGQLITSLSFPVCLGASTFVSSTWFPPDERTTATAVGTLSVTVGAATGFLVGPILVPYSATNLFSSSTSNNSDLAYLDQIRGHFKELMYLQVFTLTRYLNLILIWKRKRKTERKRKGRRWRKRQRQRREGERERERGERW